MGWRGEGEEERREGGEGREGSHEGGLGDRKVYLLRGYLAPNNDTPRTFRSQYQSNTSTTLLFTPDHCYKYFYQPERANGWY